MRTKQMGPYSRCTGRLAAAALLAGMVVVMPAPGQMHAASSTGDMGMGSMGGMNGSGSEMDMIMTPITGKPTAADQAKVASVLAATKAATAKYQDISLAVTDGYTHHTPFYPYAHFSNYLYAGLANTLFDPTRPTSMLYAYESGKAVLAGVMYTAPASDTPAQLARLLPSTIVSWHQHMGMCYSASMVMTGQTQASCTAMGGTYAAKSQWMVHAWIYIANPDGTFAIKNPAVPWPTRAR